MDNINNKLSKVKIKVTVFGEGDIRIVKGLKASREEPFSKSKTSNERYIEVNFRSLIDLPNELNKTS